MELAALMDVLNVASGREELGRMLKVGMKQLEAEKFAKEWNLARSILVAVMPGG